MLLFEIQILIQEAGFPPVRKNDPKQALACSQTYAKRYRHRRQQTTIVLVSPNAILLSLHGFIDISHRQPKEANVCETLPYKGCALRTCVQDNANEDKEVVVILGGNKYGQITLAG